MRAIYSGKPRELKSVKAVELARDGKDPQTIAVEIGSTVQSVRVMLSKARTSKPRIVHRTSDEVISCLTHGERSKLTAAAYARGMNVKAFSTQLLKVVIGENLIDPILDDGISLGEVSHAA